MSGVQIPPPRLMHPKSPLSEGVLYIVATPIGNASDITQRAVKILNEADMVAAEDTRTTQNLFKILGIKNRTISNHKFNEKNNVDYLVTELEKGKKIALVSDAGTPCINDPGWIIVKAALERNIPVIGIPGASSVMTALCISGFPLDSFAFYGFLPRKANDIKTTLDMAGKNSIPLAVFFESPRRIKKTLEVFAAYVPQALLCLCNDLTKMYERIYRGTSGEILEELNTNPSAEKGEYTLVAYLGTAQETIVDKSLSYEAMLVDHIVKAQSSSLGNMPQVNVLLKQAVASLAQDHKIPKKEFYAASINLRKLFE